MLVTITPPQRSFNLMVGSPPNLKPLDVTVVQCDALYLSADARVTIDADLTQNHPVTSEPVQGETIVKRALSEFVAVTRSDDTHYHGVYCHSHHKRDFGDAFAPYQHSDSALVATLIVAQKNGVASVAIDGDRSFLGGTCVEQRAHSRVVATIILGIRSYMNEINWETIGSHVDTIIFAMGPEAYSAWEQNVEKLSAHFLRQTAEHRAARR